MGDLYNKAAASEPVELRKSLLQRPRSMLYERPVMDGGEAFFVTLSRCSVWATKLYRLRNFQVSQRLVLSGQLATCPPLSRY